MADIINNYFSFILNPFSYHKRLKNNLSQFELGDNSKEKIRNLEFHEVLVISWIFLMISTVYSLVSINLSHFVFETWGNDLGMISKFMVGNVIDLQIFAIMIILTEVVMFPIILFFYAKMWKFIIGINISLFNIDVSNEEKEKKINQVVNYSFTSYTFLIIPVFGNMLNMFSNFFYIFSGLRTQFNLTRSQSTFTLISPFLIMTFLFIVFFLYAFVIMEAIIL